MTGPAEHLAILVGGPHNGMPLTVTAAALHDGINVADERLSLADALSGCTLRDVSTTRYVWDGTRDEHGAARLARAAEGGEACTHATMRADAGPAAAEAAG